MEQENRKRNKNILIIVGLIVLVGIGALILFGGQKGTGDGVVPPGGDTVVPGETVTPGEQEEKENPYDLAKEVKPSSDSNVAFYNDFKAVFDLIFGGAKLTSASSDKWGEELVFIVKRQTTEEDAQRIKDLLEEKGYETTRTRADTDAYRYDFSKEVLGEEYDDIAVSIWLEQEGSKQQKVSVYAYK